MHAVMLRQPPTGLRQATLANVLTDATRLAATQGDGLPFGSGYGVFPAVTNLLANTNGNVNTTGLTDNSSTTSAVASTQKFNGRAFRVVSGNAAANEGPSQLITGGIASTQYTVSAWAWLISGAATVRATVYDTIAGKQGGTAVVLTAVPQKIQVTATTGALGINEASFIETTVQQAGTWEFGGWQVQTGSVDGPYAGDAGTLATGRAQVPMAGLASATQGAVFTRLRMGYHSTTNPVGNATAFLWGTVNPLILSTRYDVNQAVMARSGVAIATFSHAVGDYKSIGGRWSASDVAISVDGAAEVTAANVTAATIDTNADIGSAGTFAANREFCSNALYALIFKGQPSNTDWALMNSWGNPVPALGQIAMLSYAAKPTLLIPAKTADAVLLPAYFEGAH